MLVFVFVFFFICICNCICICICLITWQAGAEPMFSPPTSSLNFWFSLSSIASRRDISYRNRIIDHTINLHFYWYLYCTIQHRQSSGYFRSCCICICINTIQKCQHWNISYACRVTLIILGPRFCQYHLLLSSHEVSSVYRQILSS